MGKRSRRRGTDEVPRAPDATYADAERGTLVLRGFLSPATRRQYAETLGGGLEREDAWQRATELLFERIVVSWERDGVAYTSPRELLGRYRLANPGDRTWVREVLRRHLGEHFPEMQAP